MGSVCPHFHPKMGVSRISKGSLTHVIWALMSVSTILSAQVYRNPVMLRRNALTAVWGPTGRVLRPEGPSSSRLKYPLQSAKQDRFTPPYKPGFHYPSWRAVLTGNGNRPPVNSASGNRALILGQSPSITLEAFILRQKIMLTHWHRIRGQQCNIFTLDNDVFTSINQQETHQEMR